MNIGGKLFGTNHGTVDAIKMTGNWYRRGFTSAFPCPKTREQSRARKFLRVCRGLHGQHRHRHLPQTRWPRSRRRPRAFKNTFSKLRMRSQPAAALLFYLICEPHSPSSHLKLMLVARISWAGDSGARGDTSEPWRRVRAHPCLVDRSRTEGSGTLVSD